MENKENVKRARNFTDFDKNLLFEIVKKHVNIIENKKTDATNIKIKNDAWNLVTQEFNSNCQSGSRTSKQLHALYEGMKEKARKNLHEDKKEIYKTGGGVFTPKSDTIDIKIVETLSAQFKPLENEFDSSANYLSQDVYVSEVNKDTDNSVRHSEPSSNSQHIEPQVERFDQGEVSHEPIKKADVLPTVPSTSSVAVKRKIFPGRSCEKKEPSRESYLNRISNRLIERKNKKDDIDSLISNKKLKILEVDEA